MNDLGVLLVMGVAAIGVAAIGGVDWCGAGLVAQGAAAA